VELGLGEADVELGLGEADVELGLGEADVELGLGEADVELGLGDADVGHEVDEDVGGGGGAAGVEVGLGNGLSDAATAATGKNAAVPATSRPAMVSRRRHATRLLATADLGSPNLALEILASKVTVAPAPSFREPPEAVLMLIRICN